MMALQEKKNFSSLLAIYLGVSSFVVTKIKPIWSSKLVLRLQASYDQISSLCSIEGTFKKLHNTVKEIERPVIPYIGTYLQEIIFCEEKQPKITQSGKLNCYRLQHLSNIVSKILYYQEIHHPQERTNSSIINWLLYYPRYSEDKSNECAKFLVSPQTQKPRQLMDQIEKQQHILKVAFLGPSEAGKSTIIRNLLLESSVKYNQLFSMNTEEFKQQVLAVVRQFVNKIKDWDIEKDPFTQGQGSQISKEEANAITMSHRRKVLQKSISDTKKKITRTKRNRILKVEEDSLLTNTKEEPKSTKNSFNSLLGQKYPLDRKEDNEKKEDNNDIKEDQNQEDDLVSPKRLRSRDVKKTPESTRRKSPVKRISSKKKSDLLKRNQNP
eukprot:TRINITY_DN11461_c0_g1_i5.p1 TRINITY_DN11461_c0_g1~~TRINITY_DN11461_c0_g1_i5.p1  ORF type:complete len:382 (+),score=100.05 TRINITY_DN11461_c0_g1_i5:331-1476(+)